MGSAGSCQRSTTSPGVSIEPGKFIIAQRGGESRRELRFLSVLGERTYRQDMVDKVLLERVMQLDEQSRLELRDAIEASVRLPPLTVEEQALLDERVAEDDAADWDGYVTLNEDEREMRARRRVA